MKRASLFSLVLLMSVAAVPFAGDVQVSCEPGLRIYLDGEFMGISTKKKDGFFLIDVPGGTHAIQVEKDGFLPQRFEVKIPVLPIEVKVEEFTPDPLLRKKMAPSDAELTLRRNLKAGEGEIVHEGRGSLRVFSRPLRCTVHFSGLIRDKTRQRLNLSHIPAGEHQMTVSWRGQEISSKVLIRNGERTVVAVSFMKGDDPFVISYEPE
jgi:hypothetical protein